MQKKKIMMMIMMKMKYKKKKEKKKQQMKWQKIVMKGAKTRWMMINNNSDGY